MDLEGVEGNIWFLVADNISPLRDGGDDVYSDLCHDHLQMRKTTTNIRLQLPLFELKNTNFSWVIGGRILALRVGGTLVGAVVAGLMIT